MSPLLLWWVVECSPLPNIYSVPRSQIYLRPHSRYLRIHLFCKQGLCGCDYGEDRGEIILDLGRWWRPYVFTSLREKGEGDWRGAEGDGVRRAEAWAGEAHTPRNAKDGRGSHEPAEGNRAWDVGQVLLLRLQRNPPSRHLDFRFPAS